MSLIRLDKIEFSPFCIRSSKMRCSADPEASVSRQPFLPQWQIISLSKVLVWPNSPENPDFPDGTFDVIVSRNLTWTLPDAARAYKEWIRVLKTGGILINADANYGADDFSDTADLPANHAHFTVGDAMMQECEEIKRQLPISSYVRPAWDLETLGKLGINRFSIDLGISSRIYTKKDEFYNPTPMFLVCGEKNS